MGHVGVGARRLAAAMVSIAGLAACALVIAAPTLRGIPNRVVDQTIHAAVAAAFIGAGVVATLRRRDNPTGWLMVAVGFLWLVSDLGWIAAPLTFTLWQTYAKAYQAALGHLALAFPTGHLQNRRSRIVIASAYVWTIVTNPLQQAFVDQRLHGCEQCPRNLMLIRDDPHVHEVLDHVTTIGSLVLILAIAALVVVQWRQATLTSRRVMAPVLWAVGPALVYLVAREVADNTSMSDVDGLGRFIYDFLPLTLVVLPVGFLIGLSRSRLSAADLRALLPELTADVRAGHARDALARTLHDPGLELRYWSPSAGTYVDANGRPCASEPPPGRRVRELLGDDGPVAALVVDEAALQTPELLDAVCDVARLALENERLHAEVRSQLVQLQSTTARIVEAGHDARRQLERDLHDGAQQRLLALSMALGQARHRLGEDTDPVLRESLDRAGRDLQQAIGELRDLARGIHPMLLTQEGLASALRALAERAPIPTRICAPDIRFDESIESTAYFIASEAITNATRHSAATEVVVEVTTTDTAPHELVVRVCDDGAGGASVNGSGSGLQGMRDRAVAAGGRLVVESPPSGGTTITAWLPCE